MAQEHFDRLTAIDASFLHQEGPTSHMHVGGLSLFEGPREGGFALISKTHHALVDGIAGVDIAQVIFDLGPVPTETPHPDEAWAPAPEPSSVEVLTTGALGLVRTGLRTAGAAVSMAT